TQSFASIVDQPFTVAGVNVDSTWGGAIDVNAALTVTGNLVLASGSMGGPGAVSVAGKASSWTGGTIFPGSGGWTNKGSLTIDTSKGNLGLFTPLSAWLGDGNANDSGLNGNNGTLQGGATFASGITGQAFSFNGSTGYVQAANTPLWGYGTNDFTVNLWVNFKTVPSSTVGNPGDVFIGEDNGGGSQNKWFFALGGGDLNFHINNTSGISQFIDQTPFTPNLNQWYDLAVTRSANTFTIFVNGVAAGSQTNSTPIPTGITAPLTIGTAEGLGYVNGLEDDIAVYNRALSATDIQSMMNGQGAGTLANSSIINVGGSNSLFLGNGATLNNAKGAKFNLTADANVSNFIASAFTNAGTLSKIKGTGTSTIATALSNTGTVSVKTGTVAIAGSVAQVSGSTLTAGAWNVTGSGTVHATLDISSAGTLTTLGSHAKVALSGLNSAFTNLSGLTTIDAGGSFSLLGGQSFTTVGDFTNNGKLTLSPGSMLSVAGSFTQISTGTLTDQVKTINSTTTEGEIKTGASGTVRLGGKLVLAVLGSGLSPLNVPFTILDDGDTSNSISGAFSNLPAEGSTITVGGHTYKISYVGGDGNDVTLTRIS
ncbi:MAG TPA: LamG domain-containing protein, partial [Gemmataceae bacterium]|nr:LamG domain-containing protein [Gemmataceae bacterium]